MDPSIGNHTADPPRAFVVHIRLEKYSDPLRDFLTRIEANRSSSLRAIVSSSICSAFCPLTPVLLQTSTLEKRKEIEWYYERYSTTDSLNERRAAAAERLLQQHGAELLRTFMVSNVLPRDASKTSIILQISSESSIDYAEHDVSQFLWELLEDTTLWQDTLGLQPSTVLVVRTHQNRSSQDDFHDITRFTKMSQILVLTARLTGQADVPHRLITLGIQDVARKAHKQQADVDVKFVRPGSFESLSSLLSSYDRGHFDLLHLDLHGSIDASGQAILYFITVDSNLRIWPHPVHVKTLVDLLVKHGIRVVVLNACRSAANDQATSNLAQQMIEAGILATIGMQFNVLSRSAEFFVRYFYETLLLHKTTVLQAVKSARNKLQANTLKTSQLGDAITLKDFIVPTVHLNSTLLKSLISYDPNALDIPVLERESPANHAHSLIGREGDLLFLETVVSSLPTPCINIFGQPGIGKTAFLKHLQDWWSQTSLTPHTCFLSLHKHEGVADSAHDLTQHIAVDMKKQRQMCQLNSDKVCNHRFLVVLDNIDELRWMVDHRFAIDQKTFRTNIRRSKGTTWIMSSTIPIAWISRSIAVPYELAPLKFSDAFTLASMKANFRIDIDNTRESHTIRSYYEEFIEFCSGNPMAIGMVMDHLNTYFEHNPSANIRTAFRSFLNRDEFFLDKSQILASTDSKHLRLLCGLLQPQDAIHHSPDSPSSLVSSLTLVDDGSKPNSSIAARSALILSLSAFCGSMPRNIEPFITTLSVQESHSQRHSEHSSTMRRILLNSSETAGETKQTTASQMLGTISSEIAKTMSTEALDNGRWLECYIHDNLRIWISSPKNESYGEEPWSWQRKPRFVNPVFTLVARHYLHTLPDPTHWQDNIQSAFAAQVRYDIGTRGALNPNLGDPQSLAISKDIDDDFMNSIAYVSSVCTIESWPDDSDWLNCQYLMHYDNKDVRRERVVNDWASSFIAFVVGTMPGIKSRFMPDQDIPGLEESSFARNSRQWENLAALEHTSAGLLIVMSNYRLADCLPMDDIEEAVRILEDRPLIVRLPRTALGDFFKVRMKACLRMAQISKGAIAYQVSDDISMLKEQQVAAKRIGLAMEDIPEVDPNTSGRAQIDSIISKGSSIGLREDWVGRKLRPILNPQPVQTRDDVRNHVLASIPILQEVLNLEAQTSNDTMTKANVLRFLANCYTALEQYAMAASLHKRVDELLVTLDSRTLELYNQRFKVGRLLNKPSISNVPPQKTTEEQSAENIARSLEKLQELRNESERDLAQEELHMNIVANTLTSLHRYSESFDYYHQVIASRRSRFPFDHDMVLGPQYALAKAYVNNKEYEKGVSSLKTLCLMRENRAASDDNTRVMYNQYGTLGLALNQWFQACGRKELALEAEINLKKSYEGHKSRPNSKQSQSDLATTAGNLGTFYGGQRQQQYLEAERYFRESLSLRRGLAQNDDNEDILTSQHNLANILDKIPGKVDAAQEMHLAVVDCSLRLLGSTHPDTLLSISNFGVFLERQGKINEAQRLAKQYLIPLLQSGKLTMDFEQKSFSFTVSQLGQLDQAHLFDSTIDPTEEAAQMWSLAIQKSRDELSASIQTRGEAHNATFDARGLLIRTLLMANKVTEAITEQSILRDIYHRLEGPESSNSISAEVDLLTIRHRQGDDSWADDLPRICELARTLNAIGLPYYLALQARSLEDRQQFKAALPLRQEIHEIKVLRYGERSIDTVMSLRDIGVVADSAGDYPTAIAGLEGAAQRAVEVLGNRDQRTAEIWTRLGQVYNSHDEIEKANEQYEKACVIWRTIEFVGPQRAGVLKGMIDKYEKIGGCSPTHIENLFTEELQIRQALVDPKHPDILELQDRRSIWRKKVGHPS